MKKVFVSLALIVMVLAITSCQSSDDFVVVNRSDAPIEVVYVFLRSSSGYINVEEPRLMETSKLKDVDRRWEPAPRDQYLIDPQAGRVAVQLAPGKALRLNGTTNYREESADADARFGISSLSLTGAKGSIRLEGRQARMLFKYEEKYHVLNYE